MTRQEHERNHTLRLVADALKAGWRTTKEVSAAIGICEPTVRSALYELTHSGHAAKAERRGKTQFFKRTAKYMKRLQPLPWVEQPREPRIFSMTPDAIAAFENL